MDEADLVVVTDTGSTDDTIQKLRDRGAQVHVERVEPWRFDTARNISLGHLPEDADICICVDLDEVFEPGWREKLEAVWKPSHTRARYLFTWTYNADGTPRKQSIKEKIHRRKDFKWVHPVHEVLAYSGSDPDQTVFVPGLVLNHYPDLSKPRTQYLPLLELSAKENPSDSQTIFWLGREYGFYGKHDACIDTLQKYLALPTTVWDEERSAAMRFIAAAYDAKKNTTKAKAWLYKAIAECPGVREPYLKLARLGYAQSDWPLTYAMVKNGLAVAQPSGSYLVETECWRHALYDLGAISAYRLGLLAESRKYAVQALAFEPEDKRLQNNLRLIQAKIDQQTGGEGQKDEAL